MILLPSPKLNSVITQKITILLLLLLIIIITVLDLSGMINVLLKSD
jgi:hypothetical protein